MWYIFQQPISYCRMYELSNIVKITVKIILEVNVAEMD